MGREDFAFYADDIPNVQEFDHTVIIFSQLILADI